MFGLRAASSCLAALLLCTGRFQCVQVPQRIARLEYMEAPLLLMSAHLVVVRTTYTVHPDQPQRRSCNAESEWQTLLGAETRKHVFSEPSGPSATLAIGR